MPAKRKGAEKTWRTVGVRATLPWWEWATEGAAFCRTDLAKLFDAAVVEYLKARGFDKKAPSRVK